MPASTGYFSISGWSAIRWLPTAAENRSLTYRMACRVKPQRLRDHSMPSMLITIGMRLNRCQVLKTPVL